MPHCRARLKNHSSRKKFILSFVFIILFRKKGYGSDLINPIKRSKMAEDKHGGQRNGKRK